MSAAIPGPFNIGEQLDALHRHLGAPTDDVAFTTSPDGARLYAVVRDGYTLKEVSAGFVGRRDHIFTSLADFASWLDRNAEPANTDILVDDDEAVAVLSPRHPKPEIVRCSLLHHPRAARWLGALDRRLSQRDLQRLLIAGADDTVLERDKKGEVLGRQAESMIEQVSKLSVVLGGEVRSEIDARGMTTFSGSSGSNTVNGSLPSKFTVRVPWFVDVFDVPSPATDTSDPGAPTGPPRRRYEPTYDLVLLLEMAIDEQSKRPVFVLNCPVLDEVRHNAVQDASAWFRHCLGGGFLVGMGEARHGNELACRLPSVG